MNEKGYGRDPLLQWFAAEEPIMSPEEREAALRRWREDHATVKSESFKFWLHLTRAA